VSSRLSIRVTAAERRRLVELRQERGCRNISEVARLLMGFPRDDSLGEIFDGSDDIENVDKLCSEVLRMIARIDDAHQLLTRIARHLGLPMRTTGGSFDDQPVVVDAGEAFPTRGGNHHPVLPEGFVR